MKYCKSHAGIQRVSGTLHRGTVCIGCQLLILEGAGSAVAADRNILANDLAFLPLVVSRKDLGDADLRRALVTQDGCVVRTALHRLLAKEVHLVHLSLWLVI